ncbi:MAG: hypothetical protein M3461_00765 [Pseudomonadota bacterium]|nr:hypothetical protein [Pseudomonadota bacterium]
MENAIQHTQSTALKGRRFESIEAQNASRALGERFAALRIHGRKKRQVMEMYLEEGHTSPRSVDDAGRVAVESAYYAALPAPPHSKVTMRIYARESEILDAAGGVLRRQEKSTRKGNFQLLEEDRLFDPSRETVRLIARVEKIGPNTARFARELFAKLGRPGQ